ncbi:uncharacterized protein EI97DRAFT_455887 [Westerdykella ornata]|uniref:Survival Motor Neuron Gemin2-binding domain-containing protein n=1 Tax=Westerdykella ornata TaxID=318751 RepID=A0A6A6JSY3_WESOR|nr:uncharacterized protein EI97DRAFT_455887 [Westerdykella ornata]KAF2279672.1 hypothetical protein EI97DRAFT_455887 [Westerdykella ornata]
MSTSIDLHDRHTWDDAALIDSWEEALAEYKKYHSIRAQGKRLEDVLTEEELRELRKEHGDLVEAETRPNVADGNNHADQVPPETENGASATQEGAQAEEPAASGHQWQPSDTDIPAPPQAMLGQVQDENLKNLMMSWYYAGYYTGLYTGQQKKSQE